jgi:IclR family acetate operon transcriptional repressor
VRFMDAAEVLGISASTAHRLLAILVYRDFAEQPPDRAYGPGPVLRPTEQSGGTVALLRRLGPPHPQELVDRVDDSANLMVRVGIETRFGARRRAASPIPELTAARQAMGNRCATSGAAPPGR